MAELLVLFVFIGGFCGALALAELAAYVIHDFFNQEARRG